MLLLGDNVFDANLETIVRRHREERVDAVPLDGWRIDVGYPEGRDEAECRLREPNPHATASAEGGIDG